MRCVECIHIFNIFIIISRKPIWIQKYFSFADVRWQFHDLCGKFNEFGWNSKELPWLTQIIFVLSRWGRAFSASGDFKPVFFCCFFVSKRILVMKTLAFDHWLLWPTAKRGKASALIGSTWYCVYRIFQCVSYIFSYFPLQMDEQESSFVVSFWCACYLLLSTLFQVCLLRKCFSCSRKMMHFYWLKRLFFH